MEFLPRILTLMILLSAPTATACWSVPVHAQAIACSQRPALVSPSPVKQPQDSPRRSAWRSSYLVILVCLIFSFACELMSLGVGVSQVRSMRHPLYQSFHNRAMLVAFWLVLTVGLTCITAMGHVMADGARNGTGEP